MTVKKIRSHSSSNPLLQLGRDLRALRRVQGLTLADLAEASGLSVSFLSKIERGQARPSVTALQAVAEALGVPVGWFFETDGPVPAEERPFVVRATRRRKLTYSGIAGMAYMGFEDRLLSANLDGQLALGISTYDPGGGIGDGLYTHESEEAGLVLRGEIELTLDRQKFLLNTGDSFSLKADIPHKYRNPGDQPAQIVWANTPVSPKGRL